LRDEGVGVAFGGASAAFFLFLLVAASASAIFAGVGLLCRRLATGASGGQGATSEASTRLPPGLAGGLHGRGEGLDHAVGPQPLPPSGRGGDVRLQRCRGVGNAGDGSRCGRELRVDFGRSRQRTSRRQGVVPARTTEGGK
jgi:hypothetical protein